MTLAQAEAKLKTIAGQLAREYPNDNAGRSVALLPLAQATINPGFRQNMVSAAGLLLTVVGLVLLIACANVANLLLARAHRSASARSRCASRSAPRAAAWCGSSSPRGCCSRSSRARSAC